MSKIQTFASQQARLHLENKTPFAPKPNVSFRDKKKESLTTNLDSTKQEDGSLRRTRKTTVYGLFFGKQKDPSSVKSLTQQTARQHEPDLPCLQHWRGFQHKKLLGSHKVFNRWQTIQCFEYT